MRPNSKLNVWRLVPEQRIVTIEGQKQILDLLVLRDEHGVEKRAASDFFGKQELQKWYRDYNRKTKTEDLPASKQVRKRVALAIADLKRRGFTQRHYFYRNIWNRKKRIWEYKRWEVITPTPWKQRERGRCYEFFKTRSPNNNLTLFVLSGNKLYMQPIKTKSEVIPIRESTN